MTATEVHATCVAIGAAGVLLRGASGAGKSDLALRLIEGGARLVADDRVRLARDGGAVIATAPERLAGLIEARGLGIIRLAPDRCAASVRLDVICDLVAAADVDRLPEADTAEILGLRLRRVALAPFEATAVLKLRLAAGVGPGSIIDAT